MKHLLIIYSGPHKL